MRREAEINWRETFDADFDAQSLPWHCAIYKPFCLARALTYLHFAALSQLPLWIILILPPFRCFSGFYCWNAAAAHIASACWRYYDHRLPGRDPNEDAEDACFASCCFQPGHRWVRYISSFMCCWKHLLQIAAARWGLWQDSDRTDSFFYLGYWGFEHWWLSFRCPPHS